MKAFVAVVAVVLGFASCAPDVGDFELKDLQGKPVRIETDKAEVTVVCFLAPECPLSQNYAKPLNELTQAYASNVHFYNVFSGNVYSQDEIRRFVDEYALTQRNVVDEPYQLARHFGATITPEVVMIDPDGEVLYSGKIDNWIESLGVKRQVVTEFYLRDALEQYLAGSPIMVPKTQAVGCVLE